MKVRIRFSPQVILGVLFTAYIFGIGLINPKALFSLATVYDMLRSSSVYGILALGFLPIIISGGVDMSFSAVSAFATYVSVSLLMKNWASAPLVVFYAFAVLIGSALGFANGFIVSRLKAPVLVVTLGTSAVISGFMLFKFGTNIIFNLPPALADFSRASWAVVENGGHSSSFHPAIFLWVFLSLTIAFFLKYTLAGRNIYAIGGNAGVFERSGASRPRLEIGIFTLSGALSAVAGITYAALYRIVNPAMFIGQELDVVAMVVLGGASITGGKGTVSGTVIGILFINLLKNSLILVNVPSVWQVFVIGLVLFLGVCIPILYEKYRA